MDLYHFLGLPSNPSRLSHVDVPFVPTVALTSYEGDLVVGLPQKGCSIQYGSSDIDIACGRAANNSNATFRPSSPYSNCVAANHFGLLVDSRGSLRET